MKTKVLRNRIRLESIDSPSLLNIYNISYLFKLMTTFSNFFGEVKEIERKLRSIVLLTK